MKIRNVENNRKFTAGTHSINMKMVHLILNVIYYSNKYLNSNADKKICYVIFIFIYHFIS